MPKNTQSKKPAGNKPVAKNKPRKPGTASQKSAPGFFRLILSTPILQIILVVIAILLMVIFWDSVTDFGETVLAQLGWGSVLVLVFIIVIFTLFVLRKPGILFRRWNRWIGAIAFIFVVWGILSSVSYISATFPRGLGGDFGREIISFPNSGIVYFFRLFVLALIGVIFIAPVPILRGIKKSYLWLQDQFKKPVTPRTNRQTSSQPPVHRELQSPQPRFNQPAVTSPAIPVQRRDDNPPVIAQEVLDSQKKLEELARRAEALRPGAENVKPVKPVSASTPKAEKTGSQPPLSAAEVKERFVDNPNLPVYDGWALPPLDILDASPDMQFSQADNEQRAQLIEETLASYGVDAKVVQINAGPTVTQFGVEPGWDRRFKEFREKDEDGNIRVFKREISKTRVKVEKISSLSNDLSLALAAPSIRIEAPVPGKTFVGVEVPNVTSDMVSLRSVIESSSFQKLASKTKMAIALGKGAGGEAISADLTKMPHLLIAGATGSGKTVCLNTIVCGLLMYNTPEELRFILVDPKRVELTQYNSIPHLATPVIVETQKALSALRWLCQEMDKRYQTFSAVGARNIESYNKKKEGVEKLPYLVLVIDELADLMMAGYDEVESNLCRLAQLARATGIHLVVATQRPSVDVVTGLIKANFPTRLSFAVTSQVDSRTILDTPGAEKLLGHGDMLYLPTDAAKPKRLQGCYLSDAEIDRLVYFWGSQKGDRVDTLRMETLAAAAPEGTIGGHPRDPLLEQAKELARNYSDVSTSFLQRKLHIGYPRAARLKEQLDAVLAEEKEPDVEEGEEDILDIPVDSFDDDEDKL